MITKYIKGDITETELKYIAHGVNCQNRMGYGIAGVISGKWKEVKTQYERHFKEANLKYSFQYLGHVVPVAVDGKIINNCFTQVNYGNAYKNKKRYVNYAAIVECFETLKTTCAGEILAIPKIGCGLAGGDWNFVEQLINDTVGDDLEIWVYEL